MCFEKMSHSSRSSANIINDDSDDCSNIDIDDDGCDDSPSLNNVNECNNDDGGNDKKPLKQSINTMTTTTNVKNEKLTFSISRLLDHHCSSS